jgi:uncharacterized protein VirK/YbjX
MFRDKKFGKEGELSIALQSGETGAYLATASFVFGYEHHGQTILILGGLQGPAFVRGQGSKRSVIEATKNLSGLRPKAAVPVR